MSDPAFVRANQRGVRAAADNGASKCFESQMVAMDGAALAVDVKILSLPIGQGLMIEPC